MPRPSQPMCRCRLCVGRPALRVVDRHDAARCACRCARRVMPRSSGGSRKKSRPGPAPGSSASRAALPSISAQRKTEPGKLARLMRGELDWIAMKCLEKDRTRRYDTAIGLARDVERVPDQRGRGSLPAVGVVPAAEVRAQAPGADRGRGELPVLAGGRRHRQRMAGQGGPARRRAGHGGEGAVAGR